MILKTGSSRGTAKAAKFPECEKRLRRYLGQWTRWLKCGLSDSQAFTHCVQTLLPSIYDYWVLGAPAVALGIA